MAFSRNLRLVLGVLLGVFVMMGPAMAVEEPPFATVLRDGAFEVRDYPALVVADVTVPGDQGQAANRGFRLLAGYIFGGNQRRQSIAMTAPVALIPTPEQISKSASVSRAKTADEWVVRFTMPRSYTLGALPAPNDPRVHVHALPPARFAVLKFSGVAGQRSFDSRSIELLAAARAHHLTPIGPISLAQYDPPWTLWFMRRNEMMVGVQGSAP